MKVEMSNYGEVFKINRKRDAVMHVRYTIHQSKLPNDELIQCYCEAVRYGCDPFFIRILADTIADRGLTVPMEEECGLDTR